MAIFTVVSPIDLVVLKEYQVDPTTDANVKQGGWATFTAEGVIGTVNSNPSTKILFLVYTSTNSQSRDAFSQATGYGQATVVFGGTIEVETDNIYEITNGAFTAAVSVGNKAYAYNSGVISCGDSPQTGTAMGYVTKVGTASVTIKFTI
jgi:hypothetical protein